MILKKTFRIFWPIFFKIYRIFFSPLFSSLGVHCRFEPSCSHYFEEAIKKHGMRGFALGIFRLCRCNPLFKGGFDPVPVKEINCG